MFELSENSDTKAKMVDKLIRGCYIIYTITLKKNQSSLGGISFTDNEQQIANEFDLANSFFNEIKAEYFANDNSFCERSWGMSNDYKIAIHHGSTMVRVGTFIFGPRVY